MQVLWTSVTISIQGSPFSRKSGEELADRMACARLLRGGVTDDRDDEVAGPVVAPEEGFDLAAAQRGDVALKANDGTGVVVGQRGPQKGLLEASQGRGIYTRAPLLRHHALLAVQLPEYWCLRMKPQLSSCHFTSAVALIYDQGSHDRH